MSHSQTTTETQENPRRGRGKRAGLDLGKIVDAAATFAPENLTLQAVADLLGVNRKALNYYVPGRQSLLALVAENALSESMVDIAIPVAMTWQDACRILADGIADSLIAAGELADYLRQEDPATRFLVPADATLGKIIDAGMDEEMAARSVALLVNIATSYARDTMIAARDRDNPLSTRLKRAATTAGRETLSHIARVASSSVRTYDRRQLGFSVAVVIRGLEGLLADDL